MYVFPIKCGQTEFRRRAKSKYGYWGMGACCGLFGPYVSLFLRSSDYPNPIRTGAAYMNGWVWRGKLYCTDVPISPASVWLAAIVSVVMALFLARFPAERFFVGLLCFVIINAVEFIPAYLDTKRHDYISELLAVAKDLCEE